MQQQHSQEPDTGLSGDYEYDMAHDFASDGMPSSAAKQQTQRAVYVVTETSDTEEDLSYDLAHDVPPQRRV